MSMEVMERGIGKVSIADQLWTLTEEIFVTRERGDRNILPVAVLRKYAKEQGRLLALLAEAGMTNVAYATAHAQRLLDVRFPTIKTMVAAEQAKCLQRVITRMRTDLSDYTKSARLVDAWHGEPTDGQRREAHFAYIGRTDPWANGVAKARQQASPAASRVAKAGWVASSIVRDGVGTDAVELVDVFYTLIHGVLAIPAHTPDMVVDAFLVAIDKALADRKQQAMTNDLRREARNHVLGNTPRATKVVKVGKVRSIVVDTPTIVENAVESTATVAAAV